MLLRGTRDTVVTNIVQQVVGILVFLTLPNLLTVNEFAEVTFINVLLGFGILADCGISFVYSRRMPALLAAGNMAEVRAWNSSAFWAAVCGATGFAVVITLIYLLKYADFYAASLLLLVPPLASVVSFNIARLTAQADFSAYRAVNSFQAVARLTAIPFAYWWGLLGWFLAQVCAAAAALVKLGRPLIQPRHAFDAALLRRHLLEGSLIVLATFLWLQLLYSGRFFAAMYYPNETIAAYGLFNSGYQIAASLVIAAFMPVTVETYRLCGGDGRQAARFVYRMIDRSIVPVFLLMVAAAELAPALFAYFFPKYQIDPFIVRCLLYSLFPFPILVTLGNLFVGRAKSYFNVAIFLSSFALSWMLVLVLDPLLGYRSAAVAQLAGVVVCAALLVLTSFHVFEDIIEHKAFKLLSICGQLGVLSAGYLSVKLLWD